MVVATPPKSLQLIVRDSLALVVRREAGAPPIAREAVRVSDLADARSEAWREGCLRYGFPNIPMDEATMELRAVRSEKDASRCQSFLLVVTTPDGHTSEHQFSVSSLSHVATRATQPLIESGTLQASQTVVYELVIDDAPAVSHPVTDVDAVVIAEVKRTPLRCLEIPVRKLLEPSKPMGLEHEKDFPVFYSPQALARAEACARKGASQPTPVETGGVLVGSLATCPDSGEFSVIVTDVLEAQAAEEKTFSLSFTAESWRNIQTIMAARQQARPDQAALLVGSTHGHSFLPNTDNLCDQCEKRAACPLTSVFVSQADQTWHRSVFARQPYALCHIFGLSPRRDPVNQLYHQKDGRLQPRGYYVLPDRTLEDLCLL